MLGAHSLQEMVALLKKPRRVMLMVKAGKPPWTNSSNICCRMLEAGDIIIDGGNSLFEDTIRRAKYVESKGLLYIGTGVSGGEEGARHGPSIMPGGSPAAWPHVKPIFQAIAAKVDDGTPCCDWVGEGGAGHYVKMTHNGIEYGDMQLICEAYNLMKTGLGMTPDQMHEVFAEWNKGELNSYLIEITRDILAFKDADGSATGGQDSRHRRAERHGQVDGDFFAGTRHSHYSDGGSGLCALRLGHEGRTRRRGQKIEGAQAHHQGRPARNSSKPSARRFTRRRLSATRRGTCSCARRRRNTNGT